MSKTLVILKHECAQTLTRLSFILVTLAFPLLAVVGWVGAQAFQYWYHPGAPEVATIGYVDGTGKFGRYSNQPAVTFVLYINEAAARQALLARDVGEYLVIPADYLATGHVVRYTLAREPEVPPGTQARIADFLLSNLLTDSVSPELLQRARMPVLLTTLRLDKSGEVAETPDLVSGYLMPIVFAMLFVFSMAMTAGFLLQGVVEEKENRVIEVILSSVSARQLLVGKVLGLGVAGLTQMAVWLATLKLFADVAATDIPVLSQVSIPGDLLAWALVYFVLGFFLFAVLYAGIGSIGSTAREAQQLSALFAVPAVAPLWASVLLTEQPEHPLSVALTLFPITAPVATMMRLPSGAVAPWELALSIALLVGAVVFAFWAAAKVFRASLLMYGKRPGLRDIARSLREA